MSTSLRFPLPLAVAVVVALAALPPSSAAAATVGPAPTEATISPHGTSSCGAGRLCLWAGTGYSGAMTALAPTTASRNVTGESVYNRTSVAVRVYSQANAAGASACLPAGASRSSLAFTIRSVTPC